MLKQELTVFWEMFTLLQSNIDVNEFTEVRLIKPHKYPDDNNTRLY